MMVSFPPVDPQYANAMGWSNQDLNSLKSPMKPQPQGGNMQGAIMGLLQLLQRHPNVSPGLGDSLLAGLSGGMQAQKAQRQDTRAQAFDTASQGLMGLATSGYGTPEGLDALSSSYQAMSPSLQGPNISGRLSDLTSSLGTVAGTVPGAAGEGTAFAEDIPGIEDDIKNAVAGTLKQPDGQPYGLHEIMMHVITQYRAQGVSPQDLETLQRFVIAKWQQYGGSERPGGGYSMP